MTQEKKTTRKVIGKMYYVDKELEQAMDKYKAEVNPCINWSAEVKEFIKRRIKEKR